VPSFHLVLRHPLYRGATAALFLSGIGFSAAIPLISLFLIDELDASLRTVGLFALTNLTAPLAGYLVGSRSDRSGERLRPFRVCAVVGFVGWTAIALSTQLWMPFVVTAVLLGFTGAATAQLFAALHDDLAPDGVVAIARMALVGGWVVGPVLGTVMAAWVGIRWTFFATALCLLLQILPLGRQRSAARPHPTGEPMRVPGLRAMLPLLTFTLLTVLIYSGDTIKFAYLPVYMRDDLQLSATVRGAVIGVQQLTEIFVIPVAVLLAPRVGALRLLAFGGLAGAAGSSFLAFSGHPAGLCLGQMLIGCVWGIFGGLGILMAQQLLPAAVATASAVYVSAEPLSAAVGGLAGGLGVDRLGVPMVLIVPAVLAGSAALGLIGMEVAGIARRPDRPPRLATHEAPDDEPAGPADIGGLRRRNVR